jgi:FecR protein
MKSASRHTLKQVSLALFIAFGFAVIAQGQNREKYLISAKAGGINLVSGNVTVERKGGQQALTSTDDLQTGESVTTGAGGRVEVLLNPGSYMRVDENSEFELTDASLDNLVVRLVKGSAVVEVTGADDVELSIGINTPQTDALIIKGGIYRFNVLPNETTEILVRKGRVLFGKGVANKIKGGQKVTIGRGGSVVEIAKLNKKEQDSLDLWSKERAETLARANQRLQRRPLMTAFNNFGMDSWNTWGQSAGYGTLGLWVYSSTARSYCFLPVGSRAWSSPYGHRYGNGFGYYGNGNDWPRGYGNQSGNGYPTTGGNTTGGGSTGGGGNVNPTPAPQPQPMPQPRQPSTNESPLERGPRRDYTTQSPN